MNQRRGSNPHDEHRTASVEGVRVLDNISVGLVPYFGPPSESLLAGGVVPRVSLSSWKRESVFVQHDLRKP